MPGGFQRITAHPFSLGLFSRSASPFALSPVGAQPYSGLEVIAMEATQGDRIIVHGRTVGATDRHGVILEVRGQGGTPPYLVRFDDGHETIMYPGGDFAVERGHGNQS
jgi:hypothetical protein